jgi:hypothetical protein
MQGHKIDLAATVAVKDVLAQLMRYEDQNATALEVVQGIWDLVEKASIIPITSDPHGLGPIPNEGFVNESSQHDDDLDNHDDQILPDYEAGLSEEDPDCWPITTDDNEASPAS